MKKLFYIKNKKSDPDYHDYAIVAAETKEEALDKVSGIKEGDPEPFFENQTISGYTVKRFGNKDELEVLDVNGDIFFGNWS